jgi:hypothetical protein
MWHAIIVIAFVSNTGAITPPQAKLITWPDEASCKRFIGAFKQSASAANPSDIVIAECKKAPTRPNV